MELNEHGMPIEYHYSDVQFTEKYKDGFLEAQNAAAKFAAQLKPIIDEEQMPDWQKELSKWTGVPEYTPIELSQGVSSAQELVDKYSSFGKLVKGNNTFLFKPNENYIHPTAIIYPGVTIGIGNYIGSYCIIGAPAEHKGFWGKKGAGVTIGDNNVITGHVTIDAGTERPTVIGSNCYIMKHAHAGHDSFIGNNVTVSPGAVIGGHCSIGTSSNLGINSAIHQWAVIPVGCMIGMGCVVTKKTVLNPYRKYAGVPARDIGENVIPCSTK